MFLSHEHTDHIRGIGPLCRRCRVPVFANRATAGAGGLEEERGITVNHFTTGSPFEVGDLRLRPFPVPHDAAEPVGFTVSDGTVSVGLATDLGSATPEVLEGLSDCDALVLESNHDDSMLMEGPYPPFLKARVSGPLGHLSNNDAGTVISSVRHHGLRYLVLAHISRTNNVPDLTVRTARKALGRRASSVRISVGRHDEIGEVITID